MYYVCIHMYIYIYNLGVHDVKLVQAHEVLDDELQPLRRQPLVIHCMYIYIYICIHTHINI